MELPPPGAFGFDAAAFGLNTVDLLVEVERYPQPDSKQKARRLERRPGGQAATAMVACARLGWKARYLGRFGDDELGVFGRKSLEADGVDVSACQVAHNTPNAVSVILVDVETRTRTIMWTRHPGLKMLAADVPEDAAASARVLMVDCHETEAAARAAACARAAGSRTVIDVERVRPGIEALLSQIDVIIAAEAFPGELTGEASLGRGLRALAQAYRAALVCVTLGERGSLALCGGQEIHTPGFKVPVVDTTGAGDVFRGGFIAGWLAGGSSAQLEDVLAYANAVAALKCRALGARDGIPRREEVEAFLRTNRM